MVCIEERRGVRASSPIGFLLHPARTTYPLLCGSRRFLGLPFSLVSLTAATPPLSFARSHNHPSSQVVAQGPACGDGSCEPPFEYPGFGRFGCASDCGTFTNVTPVAVAFSTNFDNEEDMANSSWNLCMTSPTVLCWCVRGSACECVCSRVQVCVWVHVCMDSSGWVGWKSWGPSQ